MPHTYFTTTQLAYLRQHYAKQPPAHFAQQWGVEVSQVYELAWRHGIKRRAPNGTPARRRRVSNCGRGLALGVKAKKSLDLLVQGSSWLSFRLRLRPR